MKRTYEFNNSEDFYPIVLIPNKIFVSITNGIEEDLIKKELNLKEPRKRNVYAPAHPSKIKKIKSEKFSFWQLGCLGYTLVMCLIVALSLLLFTATTVSETFIIIMLLATIAILMGFFQKTPMYAETVQKIQEVEKKPEEYQQEILKYENEFQNYREENIKAEEDFKQEVENYTKVFTERKTEIVQMIHQKSLIPNKKAIRIFNPPKRGAIEVDFLETARKTLRNHFYLDMGINQNSYYPDLTLICPNTNLHIDIEIDEPYSLSDKSPIHYSGEDEKRNNYFLQHNWVIIRFAEEQVVNQPEEALETLSSIIRSLSKGQSTYVTRLKRVKVWDYEDAVIMANRKYREKYLARRHSIN